MYLFDPAIDSVDRALLRLAEAVRDTGYRFITVTPETHRRVNSRPDNRWAKSLTDVFGWSRPFRAGVMPPEFLERMHWAEAAQREGNAWRSLVRLATLDELIFLHSAYPTMDAGAVFFGPDTYRFAGAVKAHLKDTTMPIRRAVDIGCGAGPGGILIAQARPDAEVTLLDINETALRLTRLNALLAGIENVIVRRSNLLSSIEGSFDLIVANPPYLVDPLGRAYRHGGGPLGSALSLRILDSAIERLAPGGTLLLYTGTAIIDGMDLFRIEAAKRLSARNLAWSYRELDPDVCGEELDGVAYAAVDRIAVVLLTATNTG